MSMRVATSPAVTAPSTLTACSATNSSSGASSTLRMTSPSRKNGPLRRIAGGAQLDELFPEQRGGAQHGDRTPRHVAARVENQRHPRPEILGQTDRSDVTYAHVGHLDRAARLEVARVREHDRDGAPATRARREQRGAEANCERGRNEATPAHHPNTELIERMKPESPPRLDLAPVASARAFLAASDGVSTMAGAGRSGFDGVVTAAPRPAGSRSSRQSEGKPAARPNRLLGTPGTGRG